MASTFELLPAIDLRAGRVVRLEQGDFARETVFGDDPVEMAAAFASAGAPWLHVVDLDGARAGEPAQIGVLRAIATAAAGRARVEASGGIRSIDAVGAVLAAGADRIVFGTAAIRDPALVRDAIDRHGTSAVAVAVDVRAGQAIGGAWQSGTMGTNPGDLVESLASLGVETFEVTAVDRDGLLGGPDLPLLAQLISRVPVRLIASGGIRDIADLLAVRDLGCAGAIVGRALYDRRFDLAEAVNALGSS